MAATAPVLIGAEKALKTASEVLTGDIVVIKGKIYRPRKIVTYGPDLTKTGRPRKHTAEVLEPVDLEVHVNPATLGLGIGVGLAGLALAAWWSGLALSPIPREELRHKRDILAFKRLQLKEHKEILARDGDLTPTNRLNIEKTIFTLQSDIKALARETRFGVHLEKRDRFALFGL